MKTLKELCTAFIVPQRDKPKEFGGSIPWCRIEDIDGKYLFGTKSGQYVTEETVKKMNLRVIPKGSVICSCSASLGVQAILTEDCVTNQTFIGIVPGEQISKDFLYYFLKSKTSYFKKIGTGTTIPYISRKKFEELCIPAASLQRQDEIVSVLEKTEAVIEGRNSELKYLDQLIKARFVEMFGDPVTNPHGYLVQTLQQLLDSGFITYHLDGNHGGDYPRSEEFVDSGVPYIGANCIAGGTIDFSMAKYLTEERAGKLRKGIAKNEDVLFAHNATVGPTVVLHTDLPKVILSTSLTAYRCNQDKIKPNYLKAYMLSDGFIRQYSGEMKQTTRNQVPITAQKKYLFLVPPLEGQNQFASFVAQVDKSKSVVQKSLEETQLLFDSLMQKYFG